MTSTKSIDPAVTIGRALRYIKSVNLTLTGGIMVALGFALCAFKAIKLPAQPNVYTNHDGVTVIDGMADPYNWMATTGVVLIFAGFAFIILAIVRSFMPHDKDDTPVITDAN